MGAFGEDFPDFEQPESRLLTCVDAPARGPDTQLGANSLGRRRLEVGSQPVGAEI